MKKCIVLLVCAASLATTLPAKAWVLIAPTPKKSEATGQTNAAPLPWKINTYTPTILTPSNESVLRNYPRTISIQWANDGWANHTVEISCDYCYSLSPWTSIVATASSNTNEYTITLPGDNMYRVRIQGYGPSGRSAWSTYHYFTFKT